MLFRPVFTIYCNKGVSFKQIRNLQKEIYTNKDRMEHLLSSLQDNNKITELTVKFSLVEEENLKLRNQITETHIATGKMQNV